MGNVAELLSFTRTSGENGHGADVKADLGGSNIVTMHHFADAGDDAQPLPGDFVATNEAPGSGNEQVTGYLDTRNPGKAGPGEKRIYARNAAGLLMCEVWLKSDGAVEVVSAKSVTIAASQILLGGGALADFVALSTKVDALFLQLANHTHLCAAPGSPSGPPLVPPVPPAVVPGPFTPTSVAATKTKAE